MNNENRLRRNRILNVIADLKRKFYKEGGWKGLPKNLDDHDKSAMKSLGDLEDELRAEEWREAMSAVLKLAGLPSYHLDKQNWFKTRNKLRQKAQDELQDDGGRRD
jgi:hypothetical protein